MLAASRRETLRRLSVTLLGLSDESLNAVLNLACRMRCLEGLPMDYLEPYAYGNAKGSSYIPAP